MRPALIDGLALAAHQVIRATQDVDFLVAAEDADRRHSILLGLGYRCVHRSEDAANYLRGDEGLAVEALCPKWPSQPASHGRNYRLQREPVRRRTRQRTATDWR